MKFRMKVTNGTHSWWEEYDKNAEDAQVEAERIVKYFNSTLSHGEKPRTLLAVEILDKHTVKEHTWKKQNLVTVADKRRGFHDIVKCARCGITGKRFGFDADVVLDPEYCRAKVYRRCDTAKLHLAKKAAKKK